MDWKADPFTLCGAGNTEMEKQAKLGDILVWAPTIGTFSGAEYS